MEPITKDGASEQSLSEFEAYTKCVPGVTAALASEEGHLGSYSPLVPSRDPAPAGRWAQQLFDASKTTSFALDDAVRLLRTESYIDNSVTQVTQSTIKRAIRAAYYTARPALPVAFRKYLQRLALHGWDTRPFPSWPVDTTVEKLIKNMWARLLHTTRATELPFIWFWPDGKEAALIMTHDVETAAGRDFCSAMMNMERQFGVVSAFEVVPEDRYTVPDEFLDSIRSTGCEVCLHGLNHDGRLFSSEEIFRQRAAKIRRYAESWQAIGFRSPVMYRNIDWLPELGFLYDMSVPNVGHLDPQPGGCCTVLPYFIGSTVELPLTTIQDYSLFNILQERSTDLWQEQIRHIREENGLASFIIHPDYVNENWSSSVYMSLLELLAALRDDDKLWFPLPRDVAKWWRTRDALQLVKHGPGWRTIGDGSEHARIAFARIEDGQVRYRVQDRASDLD